MRIALCAAVLALVGLWVSGRGGSGHEPTSQQLTWRQQANAVCQADDRRPRKAGLWNSAA